MSESYARTPGATGRATSEWARRRVAALIGMSGLASERLDENAPGERLGRGEPISDATRNRLEPLLGRAVGAARLHVGSEAEELAGALGADAFTIEHHVFGGRDLVDRDEKRSLPLLAHELMHVIQQTRPPLVLPPSEDGETTNPLEDVDRRLGGRGSTSVQSTLGSLRLALAPTGGEAPSDDLESEAEAAEGAVRAMDEEARRARLGLRKGSVDPRIIADRVYQLMKEELLVEQERR